MQDSNSTGQKLTSEIFENFLAWAMKIFKPNTVAVYRHYLKRAGENLGGIPAPELTPAKVRESVKTWHAAQAVKRAFNWAVHDARIISVNPLERMKLPLRNRRRRTLTRLETLRYLRTSPNDLRQLLIAYRETMARPGEMRAVRWRDIRRTNERETLQSALRSGNAFFVLHDWKDRAKRKTADDSRLILISPRLGRMLERLSRRCPSQDDFIFQTGRGAAWTQNALRCRFRSLRKRLGSAADCRGESIVPYSFRHTSATLAAAAGVSDRALADALGHTETRTTSRYLHLNTDQLRAAFFRSNVWRPARGGFSQK